MSSVKNYRALVWKTYLLQSLWVGIAFFSVYPLCNWLTSRRSNVYALCFNFELSIPFIPWFVWFYLSMYLLFLLPPFFMSPEQLEKLGSQLVTATIVTGVIFLLIPTKLGFERIAPDSLLYQQIFEYIFSIDLPHNMLPSLHVTYSSLFLLYLSDAVKKLVVFWMTWLILLCLSTLFVHQHHLLDILTGLLIAFIMKYMISKGAHHV